MARRRRTRGTMAGLMSGGGPRISAVPFVVLGVLMAVVGYILLFSPLFWVQNVSVEGAKQVSPNDIRDEAIRASERQWGPVMSRSLLVVDPGAVAARVNDKLPDVANAEVTKRWPNGLVVKVSERESTLLWKTKDQYYLVDQTGTAFAPGHAGDQLTLVEDSTSLPVELGKQVTSSQFISVLLQIGQQMQSAKLPVTEFRLPETTFEVQAVTQQGWYALFDTTRPVNNQVGALVLALRDVRPYQYADLRVPGRVYVK